MTNYSTARSVVVRVLRHPETIVDASALHQRVSNTQHLEFGGRAHHQSSSVEGEETTVHVAAGLAAQHETRPDDLFRTTSSACERQN